MFTADQLAARRSAVSAAGRDHAGPVLVPAGVPVPIAGTDQDHPFHAHTEHVYLAGSAVPGSVLAFDPGEGWTLFVPTPSQEERVWSGDGTSIDEVRAASHLDRVRPAATLQGWLERRRGAPVALLGNPDILATPAAYGVHDWRSLELVFDDTASHALAEAVAESRRAKDAGEVVRMRAAAQASRAGHLLALRLARPGMTERQLQVELEAEFFRNGSERTAYDSIVGTGSNGSVLHFSPTARPLREGEIVLIDAGAEYRGYASDVTRTFPVAATFDGLQRDLYELVLGVQERAIARVRPGVEYRDLHMSAAHEIAAGLVDLAILRGAPDDLVERDAHAIFFPHGLGHMLGLATHDAGGCLAGRPTSDRFGLKWLRADLPLQENYVVTIEPGIYFIRAVLTDPAWRERYRDDVNWDRVDGLLDFGGIRIEDDILVTTDGAEVLTAGLPKSIAMIEKLRAEALGG